MGTKVPKRNPQQQPKSQEIPEDIPLNEPEDDDLDDDEHEDLLDELEQLMGPTSGSGGEEVSTQKRKLPMESKMKLEDKKLHTDEGHQKGQTKASKSSQNPVDVKRDHTEKIETVPSDPAPPPPVPARSTIPPPLPVRTSSIDPQQPNKNSSYQHPLPLSHQPHNQKQKDEEMVGTTIENRAKNLLLRRRKLYMDRSMAAKTANDRTAAIEAFETVKLFNQALEAMKEGAQLSEEDLEQIPPSPPPYKTPGPGPSSTENASQKNNVVSPSILQREPTDSTSAPTFDEKTNVAMKSIEKTTVSEDLRLVLMRQTQLKEAAMVAKKRHDLKGAKDFLILAHRMDEMVEAARCGLPIDVQQIPELRHSAVDTLPNVGRSLTMDSESLKKCKVMERELLKQIQFCEQRASKFQSTGDSKNTLLYEGLLQQSKKDLQRIQLAALGQTPLPGFKLFELSLPVLELNTAIPDDKMELKILKIENLKLPEGWKPSHCALYVYYKFPFPHGAQQTGQTATSKGTNSPDFSNVFQLDINRKTKQLLRICKRQPLKLEIYHKGGFLRSDKLFGHSDISLQDLEKAASISGSFPIFDGRKRTGGNMLVEIHISRPLGDGSNATSLTKRKWIKLG